jgi:HEAT repeat protein
LKDPNSTRRKGAAQALKELGSNAEGAVPALIEALADEEIVFEVVEALGAIGPRAKKAVPNLLVILKRFQGGTRWWIDEALRKIDPVTADRVAPP